MADLNQASQEAEEEQTWTGDYDPFADPEERRVLFAAFDSFRQYRRTAHHNTTHRRRQAFYALPSEHWQMLAEPPFSILDNLNRVDDAIDTNAEIADAILAVGLESFGLPVTPDKDDPTQNWHETATASDVNKAHSTIRQFYRDWSVEGRAERQVCYDPVLQDLHREFYPRRQAGEEIRVLVPGAGLGRLVFEVCLAGYAAEGNEISYHQLLASSWVLNHTAGAQQHALHPFALHFSNLHSRAQQLRRVLIPDVHPGSAMAMAGQTGDAPLGTMSMTAADFVVLYMQPEQRAAFDAVATVFFIDTAPNLIRYVEAIHHCLKPGGLWINVGPLLWHFEDGHPRQAGTGGTGGTGGTDEAPPTEAAGIGEPGNVELTEEEVLRLVERLGFCIEARADDRAPCGYIQDADSMLQNLYQPSHWVARKVAQP
ncbi:hypothetical protein N7462_006039 [Penicillium macrosclerotiorum]|uniref:uncharacterized protein n=1 Tax=Penicillium macrosclerotiorum TaxID=303699 RepID=UPI002546DB62|nr:uncharacterized protein N7462_006039 [Penicillium macrosclerotiorum]KAJ5682874.1 hypothetical protein N7462_006039 [Penicillium macrosclerotiorum]